jgi:hypothetical protein
MMAKRWGSPMDAQRAAPVDAGPGTVLRLTVPASEAPATPPADPTPAASPLERAKAWIEQRAGMREGLELYVAELEAKLAEAKAALAEMQ